MAATIEAILAALALIKELWAAIYKDQEEKFRSEWERDEQAIIKALASGDGAALNAFCAKYSRDRL